MGRCHVHKPLDFIAQKLKFLPISGPELAGQKVGKFLAPFQKQIIKTAYKANGEPRQNLVLCWMRKFGKSMIASWFLNYLLETKEGWRGVVGASTFDQSGHIFNLVRSQIENNPELKGKYQLNKESIRNKSNYAELSRIYSNSSANLGNIGLQTIVMDQVESMKDRSNYDALQTGMLMQGVKPHVFFLANVPQSMSHWSIPFIDQRRKDKDYSFFEYAVPARMEWASEKAKRCNPFYDLFKSNPKKYPHLQGFTRNMDAAEREAKQSAEEAISYRRYILGQKISQSEYQWIRSQDLRVMSLEKVLKWKKSRCIVGLDLSLTQDFSAAAVCWFGKDNNGQDRVALYPILHIADNLDWRRKNQQKTFREWDHNGHIEIQTGRKALNPKHFLQALDWFLQKNKIYVSHYCWDSGLSTAELVDNYPKSSLITTTARQVSAGLRWLEGRSKENQLFITSNNPAVKWQFDCGIASEKSKGYTLLTRQTFRESIDICQAAILATKWHLENPERGYTYISG